MPETTADRIPLVLDGALTIRAAEAVRARLQAALGPLSGANQASIAIDCSGASEIDLSFIQLLIAARLSAPAYGAAVTLVACPDGLLLDTLTRGGFRIVPEVHGPGFWFEGETA